MEQIALVTSGPATYTVSVGPRGFEVPHQLPDRLPEPGDVYRWTTEVTTAGGTRYVPGDEMIVLRRTHRNPYGRQSSLGNLLVRTPYAEAVWTCFEHCIAEGWLELTR